MMRGKYLEHLQEEPGKEWPENWDAQEEHNIGAAKAQSLKPAFKMGVRECGLEPDVWMTRG